jgi:hypothetical protein
MPIKFPRMNRVFTIVVLTVILIAASACHSDEGARQFVPGQGWVPAR